LLFLIDLEQALLNHIVLFGCNEAIKSRFIVAFLCNKAPSQYGREFTERVAAEI
jgi:hypothetical protein